MLVGRRGSIGAAPEAPKSHQRAGWRPVRTAVLSHNNSGSCGLQEPLVCGLPAGGGGFDRVAPPVDRTRLRSDRRSEGCAQVPVGSLEFFSRAARSRSSLAIIRFPAAIGSPAGLGCLSLGSLRWFESISRQPNRAFRYSSPNRPLTRSFVIGVMPSGGLVPKIVATMKWPTRSAHRATPTGADQERSAPPRARRRRRRSAPRRADRSWRAADGAGHKPSPAVAATPARRCRRRADDRPRRVHSRR